MLMKPFKQPVFRTLALATDGCHDEFPDPPPKRQKTLPSTDSEPRAPSLDVELNPKATAVSAGFRRPLAVVHNPPSPDDTRSPIDNSSAIQYFSILWRKPTQKKNKTWDGDGVLTLQDGVTTLYDDSGKQVGKTGWSKLMEDGVSLSIGGKEVEIESSISKAVFDSRRPSHVNDMGENSAPALTKRSDAAATTGEKMSKRAPHITSGTIKPTIKAPSKASSKATPSTGARLPVFQTQGFKTPLKDTTVLPQVPGPTPIPRHNAQAPGALVFKRPKVVPKGAQIVDVVLDPLIGKLLREHQRDGVQFLYECVMGMRGSHGEGCILADDMGLGKTLQAIALLWTLAKQNLMYGREPVVKKALIVCPVTLIDNWKREFRKWLGGDHRLGVLAVKDSTTRVSWFTTGSTYQVMITGYEKLRLIADDLQKGAQIDIVIADEGHRLKTEKNKSAQAILALNISKRVVLSGTPIQNDLSEFFAMVNFVNDGCLGTYKSFVKTFENPILKSRQPNAPEKDIELGEERTEELAQTTAPFILRRTADILADYLPSKSEYVLFCTPTPEQSQLYQLVIKSPLFQSALGNAESALQLINILKKVCNSPALLTARPDESASSTVLAELLSQLSGVSRRNLRHQNSVKIRMLDQLLHQIRSNTEEKVVIVSNWTSTLDIIMNLLSCTGLPYLRLDGDTPPAKRMPLVEQFNKSKSVHCFAFLLSARAGGQGLNLTGASRLILFDVDWNPAIEDQAMARIHRQGQQRDCRIYRLVLKGGIEEKIWMRQIVKKDLAEAFTGGGGSNDTSKLSIGVGSLGGKGKKGMAAFSKDELRDLFRLEQGSSLKLHSLMGCPCGGKGNSAAEAKDEDHSNLDTVNSLDEEVEVFDVLEEKADTTVLNQASKLTAAIIAEQESLIATGLHPRQAGAGKRKKEMKALMEYVHIDTAELQLQNRNKEDADDLDADEENSSAAEALIDDDCLMEVLRQQHDMGGGGGISWIFKKTKGISKMESSVEETLA